MMVRNTKSARLFIYLSLSVSESNTDNNNSGVKYKILLAFKVG